MHMKKYMESLINRASSIKMKNNEDFSPNIMPIFNRRVSGNNYYGYDKYGLIIRKNCFGDTKSPFGWKRNDDNEMISIHLKLDCPEDIRKKETLIYIQSRFSTHWNNKNNILRKIYNKYDNENDA